MIIINRLAGSSIARIRPDEVSTVWVDYDADVIAEKLLLQIVVAGAVGIGGGCTDTDWRAEGLTPRCQLGEVVIINLYTCLPRIVCRRLCQGIK